MSLRFTVRAGNREAAFDMADEIAKRYFGDTAHHLNEESASTDLIEVSDVRGVVHVRHTDGFDVTFVAGAVRDAGGHVGER